MHTQNLKLKIQKIHERVSFLFDRFGYVSYSQEGEDILLRDIFQDKTDGFYIDVGAYHPKRFSNTYYFYKKGWSGINIDANGSAIRMFKTSRTRDQNICCAVSDVEKKVTYFEFQNPAINSINPDFVKRYQKLNQNSVSKSELSSKRLFTILESAKVPKEIDFMSIDVEGHCLEVLKSNNWKKYSPKIVLVEDDDFDFFNQSKIHTYLSKLKYKIIARTTRTSIYQKI